MEIKAGGGGWPRHRSRGARAGTEQAGSTETLSSRREKTLPAALDFDPHLTASGSRQPRWKQTKLHAWAGGVREAQDPARGAGAAAEDAPHPAPCSGSRFCHLPAGTSSTQEDSRQRGQRPPRSPPKMTHTCLLSTHFPQINSLFPMQT